jgi:TPR repeat protein
LAQGEFEHLKPAAEHGDGRAQFHLAEAYNLGRGTVQDYAEALKWYRKAADGGDVDAQTKLCIAFRSPLSESPYLRASWVIDISSLPEIGVRSYARRGESRGLGNHRRLRGDRRCSK